MDPSEPQSWAAAALSAYQYKQDILNNLIEDKEADLETFNEETYNKEFTTKPGNRGW